MPGKSHRIGVFALTALLCVVLPAGAAGKTYEPTRKDDPAPNGCKPNNCSFREALLAANGRDGRDTVVLKRGPYEMELPDPWFSYGSTIRGQGSGKTTLDANGLDRVMQLGNDLEKNKLQGVRVTGGHSVGGGEAGGILGRGGTMTLKDVAVVGNTSDAGVGGGARFEPAVRLTIVNSRFIGNSAQRGGGAWLAPGSASPATVVIRKSRIIDNSATFGGGIFSTVAGLTITNSTISENDASEGAGIDLRPAIILPVTRVLASTVSGNLATNKAAGIMADGNPPSAPDQPEEPELHLVNSTVAGNKADNDAGGIMGDNAATVDLDNSTIGFNRANDDDLGGAVAGGIFQHSGAVFTVNDSVLASNGVGQGGSDNQCSGTFTGTGNAINAVVGCTSFNNADNTIPATLIATNLADNGGPTETMAIPQGSPAAGYANTCPKRDQRGKLRPANCDAGAFEERPKRK